MKSLVSFAVRIFGILAAFFIASDRGKQKAEKKQLEKDLEALGNDQKIDEHYRNMSLTDAKRRMRKKVR